MLAVVKKYKMNIYGANSFRYCYKFLPKTRRAMHVNYTINPPTNPLDLHNSAGNIIHLPAGLSNKDEDQPGAASRCRPLGDLFIRYY